MLTLVTDVSQSAGQTIKMVSYGVGLIGLIVSACLYLHVSQVSGVDALISLMFA